jgi:glycosyltransferase involved in cell wall biosynthesis
MPTGCPANKAPAQHRLAVVVSHPIQYYSPWFVHLATLPALALRVFYLWDSGVNVTQDRDFGVAFKWDIPLLEGYDSEFVANVSTDPGTHHFRGLDNPALVERLLAWKPDAVLMFGYNFASHIRLLCSPAMRQIPMILRGDSHNLGRPAGLKTAVKRLLRTLLFRRFSAFLAVGRANGEYFAECARYRRQVFMAPHFVDNDRFRADSSTAKLAAQAWRRELGIPDGAFVFGFVGKFEENKRPLEYLRASALATTGMGGRSRPIPVFLFVGSGNLESALRAEAAERIGKDVFFAPFQNQREMPRAYAALDVLVLPSGSETWGLCVNEAMNLGVPSIVSDLVGCGPDLIVPGKTGWVFRTGDIPDLSDKLRVAFERDAAEIELMSKDVREHVDGYSISAATEGLMRAVAAVTMRSRARRKNGVASS